MKLARIVWATHLTSPAAAAVDSVNECLLKDNLLVQANTKQCRTEQNKPEQAATKREIRKMSENQSREQLICIGRAINMEPPAVSRERERRKLESCFSFIRNYLRPRGVMPVGLQNPLRKLIQSVCSLTSCLHWPGWACTGLGIWMDSLKRIALSFTGHPN